MSKTNDFLNAAKRTIKKKSEIKETDIEEKFCDYAKTKKCNALKLSLLRRRGFPDRTILCPGARIFFIEFKKKGEKLTPTQLPIQKMLIKFGFKYYKCDEIGQAESRLDEFLANTLERR